jgi:hypothetical protein
MGVILPSWGSSSKWTAINRREKISALCWLSRLFERLEDLWRNR